MMADSEPPVTTPTYVTQCWHRRRLAFEIRKPCSARRCGAARSGPTGGDAPWPGGYLPALAPNAARTRGFTSAIKPTDPASRYPAAPATPHATGCTWHGAIATSSVACTVFTTDTISRLNRPLVRGACCRGQAHLAS